MKIGQIKIEYLIDSSYPNSVIFEDDNFDSEHYEDVSSIFTWSLEGATHKDYHTCREEIKKIVNVVGFNNLSNEDKKIVVEWCALDNINTQGATTIVTYYMMQGKSQLEAKDLFLHLRTDDITKVAECCYNRSKSSKFKYLALKYLVNPEKFLIDTTILLECYQESALFGSQYGNYSSGILDYINGTGDYINIGMQLIGINNGLTLVDCRKDMVDLLFHGKI
jgi:hypothetical protein